MIPLLLWWSPVRYLFPALTAIDIACLLSRGTPWRGVWASTLDWPGGAMLLLGPVVVGVAAWRAVAANAGLGEAVDVGGRGWVAQRAEAAAVIGWSWLAHLATVLVAATISIAHGAPGVPDPLPLLPQFFILVAYASLGVVAGNLVPSPLIAPLASVTTLYLVTQYSAATKGALWVSVGGATVSLAGFHYNPRVLAAQTLLGAAAGLLVYAVHRTAAGRLQLRPPVASVAVVAVVGIGAWLAGEPPQYLRDAGPPKLTCAGSEPRVCVLPPDEAATHVLSSIWSREISVATDAGATGLPTQMDQVDSATELPGGHRSFNLDDIRAPDGGVDALSATLSLVIDRGQCLSGRTPPPARAIDRLQLAAEYLVVASGIETPAQVADPAATELMKLPVGRQRRWLSTSLAAAATCAFGQMPPAPAVR